MANVWDTPDATPMELGSLAQFRLLTELHDFCDHSESHKSSIPEDIARVEALREELQAHRQKSELHYKRRVLKSFSTYQQWFSRSLLDQKVRVLSDMSRDLTFFEKHLSTSTAQSFSENLLNLDRNQHQTFVDLVQSLHSVTNEVQRIQRAFSSINSISPKLLRTRVLQQDTMDELLLSTASTLQQLRDYVRTCTVEE
eukprot:TRINITY_DN8621_c0_g1_i1.p1 TRINITY_DN8621_c0_g1~~TRINITY_DN8621_c0_g1_i1.p1  ORF type:complete len:198 (+),score=21.12 TRINITY_DN8621_c0_g1_i1:169-762(+)